MSKKKGQPRRVEYGVHGHVDNMDYALDAFTAAVQCGSCYQWYDAAESGSCPNCDSDEVVGYR